MAKPVILTVDDDSTVLGAISRDLRRRYGSQYRVLRAESGERALQMVQQIKLRHEPLALFIVDQRMPGLSGVAFLKEAVPLFPDAKRVLLTAYADTDAAIQAINEVHLSHYLLKPWDPPEERLYPVLDDLLSDWQAAFAPGFEGIRIVGYRWSAESHQVKDFLARNLIPYQWLDIEASEDHCRLLEYAGTDISRLPLVLFPDGSHLTQPTNLQLAEKVGLKTHAGSRFYDLIVVGGGPAGLAAAVYGASEGLRTVILEREAPGGQAGMSYSIENYLGFPVGLSGGDLARRAVAQARRFGAEILNPVEATGLRVDDPYRFITLSDGSELHGRAILIATGVSYRTLAVPGADHLAGRGVYYGAAISEALAYQDRDIFIVGGGNSAGQAAMYLARYARSVTLLVRDSSLKATMSQYLIGLIEATKNISVRPRVEIQELRGATHLEEIVIADKESGDLQTLPAAALFVFIGQIPHTDWVNGALATGPQGFILAGLDTMRDGQPPRGWKLGRQPFWLETTVPGIFVAGDVRFRSVKRVASAVGEGAMVVQFVHQHLTSL